MAEISFDGSVPRVRYWCRLTKSQKRVPTSLLEEAGLIGKSYEEVKSWAERRYPKERGEQTQFVSAPSGSLLDLVDKFYQSMLSEGNARKTALAHRKCLLDLAIPFFTQMAPIKALPSDWWEKSAQLADFVTNQTGSPHQAQRANTAVKKFFEWLKVNFPKEYRHVMPPYLKTVHRKSEHTVLRVTLTPDEVLSSLTTDEDYDDVRLIGLIGYFSNLRPQEIFSLRPSDFVVGQTAQDLDCCRRMQEHGLFGRLAVSVKGQRRQEDMSSEMSEAKTTTSISFVAIWNESAAKEIAKLLKHLPTKEPIFNKRNDTLFARWERKGLKDSTVKDLRRAGLLYLGHETPFRNDITGLKAHARHAKVDTTFLYLRRPKPQDTFESNDWDSL